MATTSPRPIQKLTVVVDAELVERARHTVYALSGPPHTLTVSGLVTNALKRELRRIEKAHHRGKPFPPRDRPLRPGRKIRP